MPTKKSEKKKTSRRGRLGCAFWLAFIILVAILFAINRGNISRILEDTQFIERIFGSGTARDSGTEPQGGPAEPAGEAGPTTGPTQPAPGEGIPVAPDGTDTEPTAQSDETPAPPPREEPPAGTTTTIGVEERQPPHGSNDAEPAASRARAIWFVRISADGTIDRAKVSRTLPVSDSPLADVIEVLLAGPSDEEQRKGLTTLMPPGSRLLSAQVRGTTAYLNFSEEFRMNAYGIEGYAGQLRQVVLTATEFPNVKDVQILIDGRRLDYLGAEGIWIGAPLSRDGL